MMALDSSIYGMIRQPAPVDPLAQYGKAMSLQAMMGQNELQQLQTGKLRKDMATDEAISAAMRGGADVGQALKDAGDHKGLTAWEKAKREEVKGKADLDKTNLESFAIAAKQFRDMAATVTDDAGMGRLRESAPRLFGAEIAGKLAIPATFSEEWKRDTIMTGDKLIDVAEKVKDRKVTTAGQESTAATAANALRETGRHNTATEGTAAGQLAVSRGQLGVAQANSAETRANNQRPVYDQDRGGFASRPQAGKEATFTPVTGAPIGQKEKQSLREDADNLRKEFEAKPNVKAYRDVIPIAGAAKSSPDTRSGDIQMAYAVGKILDPASVVREGELKLVGDAATVMGKIEGQLRTLTQGKGRLTPETRAELNAMLSNAVAQRKASFDAEKQSYGGIVSRRNYKPEDVFIDTPAAAPIPSDKGVPGGAPTQAAIDAELRRRGVIR